MTMPITSISWPLFFLLKSSRESFNNGKPMVAKHELCERRLGKPCAIYLTLIAFRSGKEIKTLTTPQRRFLLRPPPVARPKTAVNSFQSHPFHLSHLHLLRIGVRLWNLHNLCLHQCVRPQQLRLFRQIGCCPRSFPHP